MIYIVRRELVNNDGELLTVDINSSAFLSRENAEHFAILWAIQTNCENEDYELEIKKECQVKGIYDSYIFTVEELSIGTFFA